jgi:hypothetical protein
MRARQSRPSRPARPQVSDAVNSCSGRVPRWVAGVPPVFTAWARCAGAHVFGALGSNSCPAGSDRISTAAACRAAASATTLTYASASSYSSFPAGCYRWTSDGQVYFNRHITGGSDASSQPLCSPAGSAGTPLPLDVATVRRRVSIGAFAAAAPTSAAPTNIGDTRAPMTALPSGTPTGLLNASRGTSPAYRLYSRRGRAVQARTSSGDWEATAAPKGRLPSLRQRHARPPPRRPH